MDSVFGLSMNWILAVLAGIMGICLLTVAIIAIFRPVVFKMALRNPPRRKAQTILIVIGLMLATLIISASLTTGDTLDHSIKKISYESLNRVDITIGFVGEAGGEGSTSVTNEPIPASLAEELSQEFEGDPDFESFMPVLNLDVPVINNEQRLSEPSAILTGLDWDKVEQIGGIQSPDGGRINLDEIGPGQAIMSETLAEDTQTEVGDTVQFFVGNEPHEVEIAAIGEDSILTGINFGTQSGPSSNGLAMSLEEVQQLAGLEGQARYIAVTLPGGVEGSLDHAEAAEEKLEEFTQGTELGVNTIKADAVEAAEFLGSTFMSLFLVLGLFSIAAGILLIFLIFTMLAAERRPEMGMARAVGLRQSQLVQMFLAEGTAYDLGAALVGALGGVLVAFAMVTIMNEVIGEFLAISPSWSFRSLAVAFSLGVTVTFITIIFASARAAQLNIVSAIRDLPESQGRGSARPRWIWWKKIPRFGPRIPGIRIRLVSLLFFPIEFIPNLLIYPIRFIVWIVRVAAYYIGWGPLLTPAGLLFMLWGWSRNGESWSMALYSIGISLLALGLMLILRRWIPERLVFSVISLLMLAWWLSPEDSIVWDIFSPIMPGDLQGDFEMFFISGIMMVTFATLLIMWNAEVFVWLIGLFGRAFARWVPAVKTAVAYPLASKTKTGLTLAMFSLIVFSLVTMSTLNANFVELFTTENASGGWDVQVQTSPANPIEDLRASLEEEGSEVDTSEFEAVGNVAVITSDNSQIREAGDDEWTRHFLNGVDEEYARATNMPLRMRAPGYESDQEVWDAIARGENVAVIDSFSIGPGGFGTDSTMFRLESVENDPDATTMPPVEVEISDPGSDSTTTVTVVGVIDDEVSMVFGLYMSQQTILDIYDQPNAQSIYVQLSDDSLENSQDVARQIESSLAMRGVQAESTEELLEEQAEIQSVFLDLISGFMGLGLLVGIAALGVIAFRAVVERRQQIGMLRAIGFQRNMIATSFLLESMVVAGLGVLSGLILGLILSATLITSDEIGADFENFIIPWTQLIVMIAIAFIAAAVMTIIPARSAASIPVADALRYE